MDLDIVFIFNGDKPKPILRLNMKEMLSFYSEVIFIDLITVINTCFSNE
jgi:hypothetical protein